MKYLFKKVKIIDPGGKHHHKICDVLVDNGTIGSIRQEIKTDSSMVVLSRPGSYLSCGWTDLGATVGEPGFEHRETLSSLANAASHGGYTKVFIFPNTNPCIHSKSEIHFIKNQSSQLPVQIFPIGAVSKSCQGTEMAELLQMHDAGASAFSDGRKPIQDSGLFMRALEYLKLLPNTILIHQSFDKAIGGQGQIDEGKMSTLLGLKGIPVLAETIHLNRDIALLNYTHSRLMVHKVSCSDAVQTLRQAKKQNEQLFSSVSILNLIFNSDALNTFDVHLKVDPPLRTEKDRKALIKGLSDHTIDCIVSDHTPWDPETKDLEFQSAAFGSLGLQTAFSAFCTYLLPELSIDLWVEKTVKAYASIFRVPVSEIESGKPADLTWFETKSESVWLESKICSISKNSPFLNQKMKGSVLGTLCNGKLFSHVNELH